MISWSVTCACSCPNFHANRLSMIHLPFTKLVYCLSTNLGTMGFILSIKILEMILYKVVNIVKFLQLSTTSNISHPLGAIFTVPLTVFVVSLASPQFFCIIAMHPTPTSSHKSWINSYVTPSPPGNFPFGNPKNIELISSSYKTTLSSWLSLSVKYLSMSSRTSSLVVWFCSIRGSLGYKSLW